MTYLLDTNVISELRKREPAPPVLAWWDTVRSADVFLSVLTIGEISQGIERLHRKDPVRAAALQEWLDGLKSAYQDRIIGLDTRTAEEWGRLNAPDPLPVIDGLLAASAKTRGWTLVTRDVGGLVRTGAVLLNPFGPLPGS